jgi:hypothetical protein
MKLTKIQISALADKIYRQIKNIIDAENNEMRAAFSFDKWKKNNKETVAALEQSIKYCKEYVKLAKINYRYNDILQVSELNIEDTLKSLFEDGIKDKEYPCKKDDIEQDIILETIEDIDINTLVDKLVDKYSK